MRYFGSILSECDSQPGTGHKFSLSSTPPSPPSRPTPPNQPSLPYRDNSANPAKSAKSAISGQCYSQVLRNREILLSAWPLFRNRAIKPEQRGLGLDMCIFEVCRIITCSLFSKFSQTPEAICPELFIFAAGDVFSHHASQHICFASFEAARSSEDEPQQFKRSENQIR